MRDILSQERLKLADLNGAIENLGGHDEEIHVQEGRCRCRVAAGGGHPHGTFSDIAAAGLGETRPNGQLKTHNVLAATRSSCALHVEQEAWCTTDLEDMGFSWKSTASDRKERRGMAVTASRGAKRRKWQNGITVAREDTTFDTAGTCRRARKAKVAKTRAKTKVQNQRKMEEQEGRTCTRGFPVRSLVAVPTRRERESREGATSLGHRA